MSVPRHRSVVFVVLAVVAAVTTVVIPPPTRARATTTGPRSAVLVTSVAGLAPDQAVYNRLVELGFAVTWMPETALDVPAAGTADLVVLSSSVHLDKIGAKLRDLPTAVLSFEGWLHDENLLSTTSNRGETPTGYQQVRISDSLSPAAQPLAGGMSGTVTVSTKPWPLSTGTPTADADIIATVPGQPGRAAIFAYDTGDHLADGRVAPAPRVGFFFSYNTPATTTAEGWALFDASVRWLRVRNGLVSITVTPPSIFLGIVSHAEGGVFRATGTFRDGSTADITEEAVWTSSDPGVAQVVGFENARGEIVIQGDVGSADIIATIGSIHGTGHVDVVQAVSQELVPTNPSIPNGSTQAFTVHTGLSNGTFSDSAGRIRSCESDNPALVTFDANCVATALSPGTTTISVLFAPFGGIAFDYFETTLTVLPRAVLVTSVAGLAPDQAVYNHLVGLGFSVTWMPETALDVSAAGTADLVVLSSSVHLDKIGNRLRDVAAPMISWEGWLHDDNLLSPASNRGETPTGYQQIRVENPTTPLAQRLAAGLSGTVTVSTQPWPLSTGTPTADADIIATVPGDPGRAAIFAYETGDHLADGRLAPAPRVGFFFSYNTPSTTTAAGWALFDASVKWLTPNKDLIAITVTPPSLLLEAGGGFGVFSAIGTYGDGSTADVTQHAVWTESDPGVVRIEIDLLGVIVHAETVGSTDVTATIRGIHGSGHVDVVGVASQQPSPT